MMKDLLINFVVPIPSDEIVAVPAMIFHKWLPYHDYQSIKLSESNIEVTFRLDIKSTFWASDHKIEDLQRWENVTVHRIYVDVIIKNLEEQLIEFMQENIAEEKIPNPEMRNKFEQLGRRLLKITIHNINRLITYCRVQKGQFWLVEYPRDYDMEQAFLYFEAKAKVLEEGSKWFRWRPTHSSFSKLVIDVDVSHYIEETEWDDVKNSSIQISVLV